MCGLSAREHACCKYCAGDRAQPGEARNASARDARARDAVNYLADAVREAGAGHSGADRLDGEVDNDFVPRIIHSQFPKGTQTRVSVPHLLNSASASRRDRPQECPPVQLRISIRVQSRRAVRPRETEAVNRRTYLRPTLDRKCKRR